MSDTCELPITGPIHNLVTAGLGTVRVMVPAALQQDSGILIVFGEISTNRPVLLRIHSRCFYGDVLGSLHCDCGEQLSRSKELLRMRGGILAYLEQEGRGLGIRCKAAAYEAAEKSAVSSFEYFDSNFGVTDSRDYSGVAAALKEVGVRHVELLTNNPDKIGALEASGLTVRRAAIVVEANPASAEYLESKRLRGHLI